MALSKVRQRWSTMSPGGRQLLVRAILPLAIVTVVTWAFLLAGAKDAGTTLGLFGPMVIIMGNLMWIALVESKRWLTARR